MNNNYTQLRMFRSKRGKYQMTAYCFNPLCTYEIEHKTSGKTTGYGSGMKTPQELNIRIQQELDLYKADGIELFEVLN